MKICDRCIHADVCGEEGAFEEALTYCGDYIGWISVDERLPEKDGRYWVWAESSYIPDHVDDPNTCEFDREAFYIGGTWYGSHIERVIAWMPLPKPYKAESEVSE